MREWEENIASVLNVSATYLLGPSGPMYKRPTNAADARWYVYDGLGSVVGEVDVSGNLMCEKKHDVFGLRRGTVGTEKSRHGWQGGLGHYGDDETGLVYMRARYYDPAIGRFISEDPAYDGPNWFVYCNNDPVNKVDPYGKDAIDKLIFEFFLGILAEAVAGAMYGEAASNPAIGKLYYIGKLIQFYIDAMDQIDTAKAAIAVLAKKGKVEEIATLQLTINVQRNLNKVLIGVIVVQVVLMTKYILSDSNGSDMESGIYGSF